MTMLRRRQERTLNVFYKRKNNDSSYMNHAGDLVISRQLLVYARIFYTFVSLFATLVS